MWVTVGTLPPPAPAEALLLPLEHAAAAPNASAPTIDAVRVRLNMAMHDPFEGVRVDRIRVRVVGLTGVWDGALGVGG
jgi:hypothetical protein